MKIAVGLSGGVDSAVAALLLKQQGHEVVGVTMKIWRDEEAKTPVRGNACYGPEEAEDIELATKLAAILSIPYHTLDCAAEYEDIVLRYFKDEYKSGRTPNPCIRCNHEVKFGVLPRMAMQAGITFDKFATGHYVRQSFDSATNRYRLLTAIEKRKDQSYFIYRLSQEQLATTLFPLGELTKQEVRKIAFEGGLPVHDKEESQDFYSGSYSDIIGEASRQGDIVDKAGRKLGTHQGIWNYTIGQRKGLGISYPEPLYVLSLDAQENRVVVGTEADTKSTTFVVTDCAWSALPRLDTTLDVTVKIRSSSPAVEATVEPLENNACRVKFFSPHSAVTPGQSAVFYSGDVLLFGGIIDRVEG